MPPRMHSEAWLSQRVARSGQTGVPCLPHRHRHPRRLVALAAVLLAIVAAPVALAQPIAPPTTVTFVQRNAVHRLRPCLQFLNAADFRLVVLQFGIGGHPIPTISTVAAQLHETPSAEYAAVIYSLRKMEASEHRGQCQLDGALPSTSNTSAAAPAATTRPATPGAPTPATPVRPTGAAAPTSAAPNASSSSHLAIEVAAAALALLALASAATLVARRRTRGVVDTAAGSRSDFGGVAREGEPKPRFGPILRRDRFVRETPRRRRYVSRASLTVLAPLFRHSLTRDAYVLRGVGNRIGPVLLEERRRHKLPIEGPDRRGGAGRRATTAV